MGRIGGKEEQVTEENERHTNTEGQRREEVRSEGVPAPGTLLRAQNLGARLRRRLFRGPPSHGVRGFLTSDQSHITHILELWPMKAGLGELNPELKALGAMGTIMRKGRNTHGHCHG